MSREVVRRTVAIALSFCCLVSFCALAIAQPKAVEGGDQRLASTPKTKGGQKKKAKQLTVEQKKAFARVLQQNGTEESCSRGRLEHLLSACAPHMLESLIKGVQLPGSPVNPSFRSGDFLSLLEVLSGRNFEVRWELKFDDDYESFRSISREGLDWIRDNLLPDPSEEVAGITMTQLYANTVSHHIRTLAAAYLFQKGKGLHKGVKARHYLTTYENADSRFLNGAAVFMDRMSSGAWLSDPRRWRADYHVSWDAHRAYNFWFRRVIDGTSEDVARFLAHVLKTYDPEFWKWYGKYFKFK